MLRSYIYDIFLICFVVFISAVSGLSQPAIKLPFPDGYISKCAQKAHGTFSHQDKNTNRNNAIDLATSITGDEVVVAPFSGTAYVILDNHPGEQSGFGNHVNIDLGPVPGATKGERFFVVCSHLDTFLISDGQFVLQGQPIGMEGCTGFCFGDHVHFSVQKGDPSKRVGISTSVVAPQIVAKDTTVGGDFVTLTSDDFKQGHFYQSNNVYPLYCRETTSWNFAQDSQCWAFGFNGGATTIGFNAPGAWIVKAFVDPQIISPPLSLDASNYTALEVKIASQAPNTQAQVFFATDSSPDFSPDKSTNFVQIKNDGSYNIYTFPLSNNPAWKGKITRLRFDPIVGGNGEAVGIESIRLISAESSPSGRVEAKATLNGQPYSGTINYNILGPQGVIIGNAVPGSTSNLPPGNYTLIYLGGGPDSLVDITPTSIQQLFAGGTISFTMNFGGMGGGELDDFAILASPSSQTIFAGNAITYDVTTSTISGEPQDVNLSTGNLPVGVTASFSRDSIIPGEHSTLTITTSPSVQVDNYTITINATNNLITRSANVGLTVSTALQNDFSLTVNPPSQTVTAGDQVQYTVFTATTSGNSQKIDLSASNLPSGVNLTFSPQSVTSGNSSTITITTSNSTPASSYTFTIKGAGSTTKTITTTLNVLAPNTFSLSVSPSVQTVKAGNSTQYSISTNKTSGNSQIVSLSTQGLPSGATPTFSPPSVASTGNSTLTIMTNESLVTGIYPFTVIGNGSSDSKSSNVTLDVKGVGTVIVQAILEGNPCSSCPGNFSRISPPAGEDISGSFNGTSSFTFNRIQEGTVHLAFTTPNPTPNIVLESFEPRDMQDVRAGETTTFTLVFKRNPSSPASPTSLRTTNVTPDKVELAWSDNAVNPNNDIGYVVERKREDEAMFSVAGNRPQDATSFIDTPVLSNKRYMYRVYAIGIGGNNSDVSNTIDVLTPSAPPRINVPNPIKDFNNVRLGQSAEADIKVENLGNEVLVISNVSQTAGSNEFTLVDFPGSIPGRTFDRVIKFKFTPDSSKPVQQVREARFEIRSNDPAKPVFEIILRGSSLP